MASEQSHLLPGKSPAVRPIVAVVGFSHTGKTSLICGLIPRLAALGLKVAVLKHSRERDPDLGKDTWRYRQAGAKLVAFAAPGLLQLTESWTEDPPLEEALARLQGAADVILVEGYKTSPLPKVLVLGAQDPAEIPPYANLIAVVSEFPVSAPVPVFRPHQLEELAAWLYDFLQA